MQRQHRRQYKMNIVTNASVQVYVRNFDQLMNFRFKLRLYAVFHANWTFFVGTTYLNKREFL